MGTPGVKFGVKKSKIAEALKKHKGVVSYAARDLNTTHGTLLKYINKDPELVELLSNLRHDFENLLLDSAENTLLYGLGKRETDLTNALKSSFYILNNKGKSRGYSGQVGSSSPINEDAMREFIAAHSESFKEVSGANTLGKSPMENEQSLLHQGQGGEKGKVPDELGADSALE